MIDIDYIKISDFYKISRRQIDDSNIVISYIKPYWLKTYSEEYIKERFNGRARTIRQ